MRGKVVIITGAGSGMGEAAAGLFAERGAHVVAADRDSEAAQRVADGINGRGGSAIAVRCDVTREEEVEAMVARAVEVFGRLDAAYNNAGIQVPARKTADVPTEEFDRIISVNLRGVFLCLKHELRQMAGQGGGAIVNNSSIAGVAGAPTRSAYAAAKHGILGLTRTVAGEYADRGIRVNAVCPGTIKTPMVARMLRDGDLDEQAALEATPMHRFADAAEVAETVYWLCSDASSYVNGHHITIDGGQTAI